MDVGIIGDGGDDGAVPLPALGFRPGAGGRLFTHGLGKATPEGAVVCATPRAVAERAGLIVLRFTDPTRADALLFGAGGVVDGLRPGTLLLDAGWLPSEVSAAIADRLRGLGVDSLILPCTILSGRDWGNRLDTKEDVAGLASILHLMSESCDESPME